MRSNQVGVIALSDTEVLTYDSHKLEFNVSYRFSLENLKAVYDVGIDELLKNEYLIWLEIPQDYTFNDFIKQVQEDHAHTPQSLQQHLKSLLDDMVKLLQHTKE